MKVMCIDPGKNWALAVFDELGECVAHWSGKYERPVPFHEDVRDLAISWKIDAIVHGTPVRHAKVIAYQSKQIGMIELVADELGIGTYPVVDNSAKKIVLGKGNATKDDIMKKYNVENEHLADCYMFYDYFMHFQK